MRDQGFTLIELLIAIIMIGILAGMAVAGSANLVRKYRVESEAKELYSDLMDARILAMHKNRTHFVNLTASSYSIYDDTNPAPNGDGTCQTDSDTLVFPAKPLKYDIVWNGSSDRVEFSGRGLANTNKTLCIYSDVKPSCDCIVISPTRISLGKLRSQGTCGSEYCEAQ